MSVKISVVMASFLGEYEFSAGDRIRKFHRAIDSFINQTHKNSELIIVSDGCETTKKEYQDKYYHNPNIHLFESGKQPHFSGTIRNIGCFMATGDIISYLDTDDFLGINHLSSIAKGFQYYKDNHIHIDWVYFDDQIVYRFNPTNNEVLSIAQREVKLHFGTIGTSSIAHRKLPEYNWLGCDGYNHDWTFVKRLIDSGKQGKKIDGGEYRVCHIPTQVDC